MSIALPDYHIHTPLCKHASGAPEEYKLHAARLGMPALCFSDHAPAPDGYDSKYRMALDDFPAYRRMIAAIQNQKPPAVGFGIEADYYPAGVEFLRTWLPRQSFDMILGSVHYIGDWAFDNPDERHLWESAGVERAWSRYFQLVGEMADTRLFDIAAHLDLPKKFGFRPPETAVRAMAAPALDRIRAAGMAIEINTAGLRKPVGEMYPAPCLLEMARARGIPICFGSDAHTPAEVGYAFPAALAAARAAGYRAAVRFKARRQIAYALPE